MSFQSREEKEITMGKKRYLMDEQWVWKIKTTDQSIPQHGSG